MSEPDSGSQRVRIDAKMRQAFKRNAPAALRRRSDRYLWSMAMSMAQYPLIGAAGLLGIHYWGWTPLHLLVLLIAGTALAVIADILRWLLARSSMLAEYQAMQADRLVWLLVSAQRSGQDDVPAEQVQTRSPGIGLAIDLVVGALAIYALELQIRSMGLDVAAAVRAGGSLQLALLVLCAAPLAALLAALGTGRGSDEGGHDELEFRAGGRGLSLLFLAGALWFFGDDGARGLMLFMYSGTLIVGVMAVLGVWLMYREREWLRAHLAPGRTPRP